MTLKQLLLVVTLATIVFWSLWSTVIVQIDPLTSGWFGFILFYASLFFALLGSFFLVTFIVRKLANRLSFEYSIVAISFRQSCMFAVLIVGMLLLQSQNLLNFLNMTMLIVGITLLEFFFLSYRSNRWQ